MCAARCAIAHAALKKGGIVLQTDCDKAYTQSVYDGPPTVVRLPKKWWPESWKGLKDPVCRLVMNLYGHPRAGNGWERHCEEIVVKRGFVSVPEWPSVFWHPNKEVLLVVYVDDLLASGEEKLTREVLGELATELEFSTPEPR